MIVRCTCSHSSVRSQAGNIVLSLRRLMSMIQISEFRFQDQIVVVTETEDQMRWHITHRQKISEFYMRYAKILFQIKCWLLGLAKVMAKTSYLRRSNF